MLQMLLIGPALMAALAPVTAPTDPESDRASILVSDRLDGTYEDLAVDLEPVTLGALSLRLASPSHRLEVIEHRLELSPHREEGSAAVLTALVEGEADLVAELDFGGLPGRLEDHIVLPRQEVRLAGRLEIERVETGYLVTVLEAPSHAELTVESQMGERLVRLCEGIFILAPGGEACAGLERSLSTVRLPLPEAGESRLIEEDQLTETERRQIEAYLAAL